MVTAFNCANKWFIVNLLSKNVDKTHYIKFKTKNKPTLDTNIVCNYNLITLPNNKFLGTYIHDSINWSCYIEYILSKLSSACYIVKSIKPFMSLNALKMIYYSYFNVIVCYGLPFWENSPHSVKISRMQKTIIKIMIDCKSRVSCRNLFRL
jgi:hypothetical protein